MPGKKWSAAVAIAAVLVLAGCTPEPTPTPTPTGFASEAEAFAAAEETYRAYVDAGNQIDLSDPTTFEALFAWSTGELNELDRQAYSEFHAEQVTMSGDARVIRVKPQSWDTSSTVTLTACVDVSEVLFFNADGSPRTNSDREPLQALSIDLVDASSSPTGLLVQGVSTAQDGAVCAR
ncbi:hypothetical protein [Microbacterium invictum]|uniref:Lipoprotein n=1 Tax=Microbacterium invictum TaxID=515415 RepID=A0AA40SNB0_9MICO|nr:MULTISPECIES: hypothetical protein [Microbacterium]MBB4139343.1 hypothetical protein [Microbacterium invictum]